jgi:hypothetical protein
MGRRNTIRHVIAGFKRRGVWDVEPWPVPEDGWSKGNFRVRNLRANMVTVTNLVKLFGATSDRIRELMDAEPPVDRISVGRNNYLPPESVEEIQKRLAAWRAESPVRRVAAARKVRARIRERKALEQSEETSATRSP